MIVMICSYTIVNAAIKAKIALDPFVIYPSAVKQGSPIMITLATSTKIEEVKKLTATTPSVASLSLGDTSSMGGSNASVLKAPLGELPKAEGVSINLPLNKINNHWTAYYGVDLNAATGTYTFTLYMKDGTKNSKSITVLPFLKESVIFDIPEKMGGNSTSSSQAVVNNLSNQNTILKSLTATRRAYFKGDFRLPLASNTVTDIYGYTRTNSGTSIAHKGTDYRAAKGTNVFALNDGKVLYAGLLGDYGNTVIVDHGAGIMSMYMHLSKVKTKKGKIIKKGALLGQSGDTGYALAPHLHLSIRIGGVSIDPEEFFKFKN